MNLLFVGDVVGSPGRTYLNQVLPDIIKSYDVDFTIVNGENAAGGAGLTEKTANEIFAAGADVITSGNHIWDRKEIYSVIEKDNRILRPANYPPGVPGKGSGVYIAKNSTTIGVINVCGRVFSPQQFDCPFRVLDAEISKMQTITPVIIVDFHGEASSEKIAAGWYFDGKVSALFGTHTHVQTADDTILPNQTAYITDVGMTEFAALSEATHNGEEWVFDDVNSERVREIFDSVREDGRDLLLSPEAAEVAECYKIPAAPSRLATSEDEAERHAVEMGFPVVMKISSPDIMHKTDIGGVKVGIESPEEVREAFRSIMENSKKAAPEAKIYGVEVQKMMPQGDEVIIGMVKDHTFGPMVAFGSGGVLVNLLQDASFRLARGLTKREVDEMITETKAYTILKGFRGAEPDDIPAIAEAIGRVAQLCRDFPEISELDINPVFAYPKGLSALDIKIKLS